MPHLGLSLKISCLDAHNLNRGSLRKLPFFVMHEGLVYGSTSVYKYFALRIHICLYTNIMGTAISPTIIAVISSLYGLFARAQDLCLEVR